MSFFPLPQAHKSFLPDFKIITDSYQTSSPASRLLRSCAARYSDSGRPIIYRFIFSKSHITKQRVPDLICDTVPSYRDHRGSNLPVRSFALPSRGEGQKTFAPLELFIEILEEAGEKFSRTLLTDKGYDLILPKNSILNAAENVWSIEMLRGIAALLVVFAHYSGIAGISPGLFGFAFTGVDLFFIISGFVFAPYMFGKPISVAPHLVRRFFRLYPLYALALLVYAWLKWQPDLSLDYLIKHALFLHTTESREIAFHFNPAFWSLPPEVEFYLALPLLAYVTGKFRSVLVIAALSVIFHLAIAFSTTKGPDINEASILNVHLPGLLAEFMFGVISWWIAGRSLTLRTRILMMTIGLLGWLALAAIYTSIGNAGIDQNNLLRGNIGLLASFTFALILTAWVGWIKSPSNSLLAISAALGNLSYGVYLFHNATPILLEPYRSNVSGPAFAMLCLAATLLIAQIAHWAVEAPSRQFGRRWAKRLQSRMG